MNNFVGKWRITEMEQWDQEYIDFVEPGYFLFDHEGVGEFVFGTISGSIDCRFSEVKGISRVEYTWEGTSEMESACGRGWFEINEKDKIYGGLFIHNSDDSWVKAEKQLME